MMTNKSKLPFYLAAIGSAALASAVHAQNVDTSDWACEYCPFQEGHEGGYEIGATNGREAPDALAARRSGSRFETRQIRGQHAGKI